LARKTVRQSRLARKLSEASWSSTDITHRKNRFLRGRQIVRSLYAQSAVRPSEASRRTACETDHVRRPRLPTTILEGRTTVQQPGRHV
jgi:hypothetical protein